VGRRLRAVVVWLVLWWMVGFAVWCWLRGGGWLS
jgi:hypothetical protein